VRAKLPLIALADHACASCGLAWPGIARLAERTGMGTTAVRDALEALVAAGLLMIAGYPRGGRARATIYAVLPSLVRAGAAPCADCAVKLNRSMLDTQRTGGGFTPSAPAPDPVIPNGRVVGIGVRDAGNPPDSGSIPNGRAVANPHRTRTLSARAHAPAREGPVDAAAPLASQPVSVGDALRRMLPGVHLAAELDRIPCLPTTAEPPDREEAQPACHAPPGQQLCALPGGQRTSSEPLRR